MWVGKIGLFPFCLISFTAPLVMIQWKLDCQKQKEKSQPAKILISSFYSPASNYVCHLIDDKLYHNIVSDCGTTSCRRVVPHQTLTMLWQNVSLIRGQNIKNWCQFVCYNGKKSWIMLPAKINHYPVDKWFKKKKTG